MPWIPIRLYRIKLLELEVLYTEGNARSVMELIPVSARQYVDEIWKSENDLVEIVFANKADAVAFALVYDITVINKKYARRYR